MGTELVIYDGDCAFCSTCVRLARRLMKEAPDMQPHQMLNLEEFGTSTEECDKVLHFISANGRVYVAHEAVRQIFFAAGGMWRVIGLVMRIPGIYFLMRVGYRLVANNRHKLPGGTPTCKFDS